MPREVQGPDGRVFEFPDDAANDHVNAAMIQNYPEFRHPIFGGQQGTFSPMQPPAESTATPQGGAVQPNSLVRPGTLSPDTRRNLMLSMFLPHAASALQHDPGMERERTLQRELGKKQAEDEANQGRGRRMLNILHGILGHSAFEGYRPGMPEADLRPRPGLTGAIGPFNSSDIFQRWRQGLTQGMLGSEQGYNVHNQLMHAVDAMATASQQSGGGTNQNQQLLMNTVGRMMQSSNPQDFYRILGDADRFIRQHYGLEPGMPVANQGSRQAELPPSGPPRVGEVRRGYRFNGGDPAVPNNWSRAQ